MTCVKRLAIILVTLLQIAPPRAIADEMLDFPARDVSITGKTTTTLIGIKYSVSHVTQELYLAAEKKQRSNILNPTAVSGFTLLDHKAKRIFTITLQNGQSSYRTMSMPPSPPNVKYSRTGKVERVVGIECEEWSSPWSESPAGALKTMTKTSTCVTKDGVTLRSIVDQNFNNQPTRHVFEAVSVTYGALSPALFRLPSGAVRLDTR